jgi:hypothetical protein
MNNKVKTLKISKAETLNEALKIQKEITGHYFYEGFVWDHYKKLDTEKNNSYPYMIDNKNGDIYYVYSSDKFGFGEKYFNKVSLSRCLSGDDMNEVNILDNEVLISSVVKYPKTDEVRKAAAKNNIILTGESSI